jgi:hypothetical protein
MAEDLDCAEVRDLREVLLFFVKKKQKTFDYNGLLDTHRKLTALANLVAWYVVHTVH